MLDGLSGRLVSERSARRLAEAVLMVLDDDDSRKIATMHGPAFVANRFGVDRMIDEIIDVYGAEVAPANGKDRDKRR